MSFNLNHYAWSIKISYSFMLFQKMSTRNSLHTTAAILQRRYFLPSSTCWKTKSSHLKGNGNFHWDSLDYNKTLQKMLEQHYVTVQNPKKSKRLRQLILQRVTGQLKRKATNTEGSSVSDST